MKTIRSILEELYDDTAEGIIFSADYKKDLVDQALAEIEDLMNEHKPDFNYVTRDMVSRGVVKSKLDEYQSNLHKALGKE